MIGGKRLEMDWVGRFGVNAHFAEIHLPNKDDFWSVFILLHTAV